LMPARTICGLMLAGLVVAQLPAQPPPLPPIGGNSSPAPKSASPAAPANNSDVELVERVQEARKQYITALRELHKHYVQTGDTERAAWAQEELLQYHRMSHPAYRLDLDVPSPKLQPLYNQPEANRLYRDAMAWKDRGLGGDWGDNQRRAEVLLQRLLSEYPQSNKISDAAYQLGDIYEGRAFKQMARAAAYFERCFQWNPATQFDARLRAARLYDRELKNKVKALELYRMVREYETDPTRIQEADRRIAELSR
ncbi:MAG: tetratricopeptide repeat protein, partial [Gemmataceae bacterium]